MLISNEFDVAQPIDRVWEFFGDIPGVAACLPGADLTEDLGNGAYGGTVGIRMGPVKLEFAGKATIVERDDATKRMLIDASGADLKGRGQAAMTVTAVLTGKGSGTTVRMDQDIQLSGAAAQYGRGMISDVTKVLMGQFADNAQRRIGALQRGESVDDLSAKPASGLSIGLQAMRMALMRVFRRFFLPYQPNPS
ncbi:carbon monoxide dehydrogenase [Nocardioides sp. Root1257]|uniref:SRPBCC family protein n=1 Tax=unclassified Nocardioides TaxID=2615069 RepID=UPI0006FCEFC8|nr:MULTISPECIES: SRPBCC family protein [unclassified Nocardioides]KQW47422.1 carbon monoxide dehydrogenase [Nocardioides sp. Root1257]KRC45578.1 carbon monoxide dehydrogenase [Nocardioides sp. Root224]